MSRLSESVTRVMQILEGSDLGADYTVAQLLDETTARRSLDLSDLSPREQAALVEGRAINMIPSAAALAEKITAAQVAGLQFIIKYGIDPTSPDVHLGHAVPIIIASRFQRMGHHVVFIIGDVTAKIGDPSGRSSERPALTDDDIARNLSTYQQQVTPFIDFERADLRFNGEWLNKVRLPQLVDILARVPVSMSLQREDFRTRLAEGKGLSVAEFVYSVVMAMDSVAITADVELGGVDQLLNLQMCRKVMEITEQTPEVVITTPLIEGTDGTGAKMSKSKGNYVGLTATPDDVYGRLMSIPDHVTESYLKLLTEWTDEEIQVITKRLAEGTAHPMAVKRILMRRSCGCTPRPGRNPGCPRRVHGPLLQALLRRHAEPPGRLPQGTRRDFPRCPAQPDAGLRAQPLGRPSHCPAERTPADQRVRRRTARHPARRGRRPADTGRGPDGGRRGRWRRPLPQGGPQDRPHQCLTAGQVTRHAGGTLSAVEGPASSHRFIRWDEALSECRMGGSNLGVEHGRDGRP